MKINKSYEIFLTENAVDEFEIVLFNIGMIFHPQLYTIFKIEKKYCYRLHNLITFVPLGYTKNQRFDFLWFFYLNSSLCVTASLLYFARLLLA